MPINRRRFVSLVPAFGGFVSLRAAAQAQVYPPPPPADGTLGESFPSHDPAVVQTIVGLSHSNLPGVRESKRMISISQL